MPYGERLATSINRSPKRIAAFMAKVKIDTKTGCWLWVGSICKRNGYGDFGGIKAYVYSYLLHKGTLPAKNEPDHLCRIRACVNPEHLEAVTRRINLLRGDTIAARKAAQTHCEHGHEFTEENVYRTKDGTRNCRKCRSLASIKWARENRERRQELDRACYARKIKRTENRDVT